MNESGSRPGRQDEPAAPAPAVKPSPAPAGNETEPAAGPKENQPLFPAPEPGVISKSRDHKTKADFRLEMIRCSNLAQSDRIDLLTTGAEPQFIRLDLVDPPRLVLDLKGSWSYSGPLSIAVRKGRIEQIRLGIYENKLRVVVDMYSPGNKSAVQRTRSGLSVIIQ